MLNTAREVIDALRERPASVHGDLMADGPLSIVPDAGTPGASAIKKVEPTLVRRMLEEGQLVPAETKESGRYRLRESLNQE